ncbi:bifunctional adenosylcobinamide kinase/adenosylcobinamide-phosphate guanylyltransferase [Thermovirga lienii]|uniref:bifunctional adenosylcobinamide kinase/adenosylcobinamide-phosphate guanylyltransferase n=1 Tax=Thermovirga lienii TaxID=336261 RepID=UPI000ED3B565|nr:bifunctional adenosylcobinamide kinase/adenosylcobinamide-phosphate guanylyltransferase [Thermovirga lienii]
MREKKLILVTGGARSGKSSFAERLAKEAQKPVTYIATCQPLDEEMAFRIQEHRKRRPKNWKTVEEPFNPTDIIAKEGKSDGVILLDCLALLVSNLLLREKDPNDPKSFSRVIEEIENLAITCRSVKGEVIVVTNEVGMGVVPEYPLGRTYRDLLGKANQIMALYSDSVYLLVCGIPVDVKQLNRVLEKGVYDLQ